MLKALFNFEEGLLRVEAWLLVSCVLLMLALAGYTVIYRNVLIPWQNHLATSGPPVGQTTVAPDDGPAEDDDSDGDGFGGGFGGGFGDDDEADGDDESDGFGGGFGGGFGDDDEADEDDESDGFGGGFGGGFGDDEDVEEAEELEEEGGGDEGGGPPPEGSLAAWLVDLIDAIKAHWTDELLRQLVIISGFLGAMLAARQRSHITIDAVGTLLEGRPRHIVDTLTSVAAGVVCVFLALSGMRLVELGIEYPRQLLPFAKEWQIQLVFPIGWSLLALHFIMRALESARLVRTHEEDDEPVDSADEEPT